MKKFEIGKVYKCGFQRIKIIKRTDKTVWFKSADRTGETYGDCYRKKIVNSEFGEHFYFPLLAVGFLAE